MFFFYFSRSKTTSGYCKKETDVKRNEKNELTKKSMSSNPLVINRLR